MSLKPSVRGAFSDRNNINEISKIIQKDNLDSRTRNRIVNVFDFIIESLGSYDKNCLYDYIFKVIFVGTGDDIPEYPSQKRGIIVDGIVHSWSYDEIFTFLEPLCKYVNKNHSISDLYEIFNSIFKEECVGYRFVDANIIDITNEEEIKSVSEACSCKYDACRNSIKKALMLLYDRDHPDYSNSVKESISAIEAICNIINGTQNSTLGEALNKLEKNNIKIHGAMKSAFSSLYGYTSDKSGIRHNTGIDEDTTFEEAKYMLISCSAFLNYLIEISNI